MKCRKQIIAKLFEYSQRFYTRYFKSHKTPWDITKKELLGYPCGSLGKALGNFLTNYGFDLIPKVERHDAYHVLLDFGTQEEDEIALQYLCFGNGKRSAYLWAVITVGTLILPEYLPYYYKSYRLGKQLNTFYNLEFFPLLYADLDTLRGSICNQTQLEELKNLYHG